MSKSVLRLITAKPAPVTGRDRPVGCCRPPSTFPNPHALDQETQDQVRNAQVVLDCEKHEASWRALNILGTAVYIRMSTGGKLGDLSQG